MHIDKAVKSMLTKSELLVGQNIHQIIERFHSGSRYYSVPGTAQETKPVGPMVPLPGTGT
jgi:hypothetical protein